MTIRTANEADAGLLAELISRSFADVALRFALTRENCPKHPSNCTAEWVEQDQRRGVQYFIAEQDGEAVGCVALETKSAETCELQRLAVLPQLRQRGVGRLLVQHVVDLSRASGAVRVCLSIIAKHSELRAWYKRLGFREGVTKTFPHFPFEVLFMDTDIPKAANNAVQRTAGRPAIADF